MGKREIDVNFNSKVLFHSFTHTHTHVLYGPLTQYSLLSPSFSHIEPLLFTVPPPSFMTLKKNDTFYLIRVAGMSMGGRLFIEQGTITFLSTVPIPNSLQCSGRGGTFGVPVPPMTGVDGSSLGQVASAVVSSWVNS